MKALTIYLSRLFQQKISVQKEENQVFCSVFIDVYNL